MLSQNDRFLDSQASGMQATKVKGLKKGKFGRCYFFGQNGQS